MRPQLEEKVRGLGFKVYGKEKKEKDKILHIANRIPQHRVYENAV
jgi:hypothetical protein